MEYGKYIIVEVIGIEAAICFDSLVVHSNLLPSFNKDMIVSAGFFSIMGKKSKEDPYDIKVEVWGQSISLGKDSREEDAILIKRVLRQESKY